MAKDADTELACLYGISPDVVEKLRREQCQQGTHWHYSQPGNRIEWLPAGLDFLPQLLQLEKKEEGGAAHTKTPGEVCHFVIIRICPNPTWVLVRLADGMTAEVQVRNNRRLSTGMRLRCTQHLDGWICAHEAQTTRSILVRHRTTTERPPG